MDNVIAECADLSEVASGYKQDIMKIAGYGPLCWVVTDGKQGMLNQCLGLAEALKLEPVIKTIHLRTPWRQLSPYLRLGQRFAAGPPGDMITPPWPDLLIGTGRQSIPVSLAVRAASRGQCFTVQIQDPIISPRHFDLVVAPAHDGLRGANVLVTRGAVHRVSQAALATAGQIWEPRLAHLPHPRVAVLIGGNNAVYRLTPTIMGDLAEQLAGLARTQGVGLMITPSRRTGTENVAILRARLKDSPAMIWDDAGDNPYLGFLALADAIIATVDSVNICTEAASTGKPVYTVELQGGSAKFRALHESLRREGITRPFKGALETWYYQPLNDTAAVAAVVREQMAQRGMVW